MVSVVGFVLFCVNSFSCVFLGVLIGLVSMKDVG